MEDGGCSFQYSKTGKTPSDSPAPDFNEINKGLLQAFGQDYFFIIDLPAIGGFQYI